MEAKDTVMRVADIPVGMPTRTYIFSPEELRRELLLQAEISFKAGVDFAEAAIKNQLLEIIEASKKAGIREVVEWVGCEYAIGELTLDIPRWQAFKKRKGIE